MRLLVIEDEADLAEAVARGLRREGYAVDVAHGGVEAIDQLAVHAYDLVCLDVGLPDVDGFDVCARLRDGEEWLPDPDAPPPRVLMLTARDTTEDRVAGLDTGADDYLVKPFAFAELSARVRSLLRRDAGRSGALLVVDDLELDTARAEARRGGRRLDLSPKELALLRYFMAHPAEVLSQDHPLEHVWDAFANPFTNTVRVTVGTLRRKLDPDGAHQPIETVVGQGYRLRDSSTP